MSTYDDAHFSWPSLYNPANEVGFLGPAVRPGGFYLTEFDGTSKRPFKTEHS